MTSGRPDSGAAITALVENALHAAAKAPSPHNTQPWVFRAQPDRIEVSLDPGRVLPVADPEAREAVLACGAALFNAWLTVIGGGRDAVIEITPDRARPDLVGVLRIGGSGRASEAERRLAAAIPRRHTNRHPFLDRPVPTWLRRGLADAAAREGTRLEQLDGSKLAAFAALLRRADHVQTEDAGYQAELRAWTHDGDRSDGVPRSAGGPHVRYGFLALRDYHGDMPAAERDFESAPLVAVLTTARDDRRSWVRAGLAMQRVLLTATAAGLAASFLSQLIEVGTTRERLAGVLGRFPQAAFRFGYGYPVAATERRPITEVTVH